MRNRNRLDTVTILDETDRRILAFLDTDPRATGLWIAQSLGLARGTVQARLEKLQADGVLSPHSIRVKPTSLGYPLRALVTAEVDQNEFDGMIADMTDIDEVTEVIGIAGASDLMIEIVARDADHVYDITQRIMRCRGINHTATSIVLRRLIERRHTQLF
jgi:DNA-binding Lrp family transcriptional regulator